MAPKLLALVACGMLALVGCTGGGHPGDTETRAATGAEDDRLTRLRDGGLTIVIRHAATDHSRPDAPTVDLDDCATQRPLSDRGRADARTIGAAVERLEVPVGEVWASPYCRGKDTAELAFGRFEVVPGLEQLYPERDEHADTRLNRLIQERAPRAGEPNLVIASHGVYPSVLTPAVTLAEGEAALYARTGTGFDLVGRITPDEWSTIGSHPSQVTESVVALAGPHGTGSAFRVAVPGILVTTASVVGDARTVTVTQPDGRRHTAEVLGSDARADIAALRITDDSALPPLHSGSGLAEARTGDHVFAVSAGAVTAGTIRTLAGTIRIDATTPADSVGGPLVDRDGAVLGVLTSPTDAIPVDVARAAALSIVRGD